MVTILTLLAVCSLAFANGANDVSRGIATLVGSGVTRFKTGLGLCFGKPKSFLRKLTL
jgi:inorganic phosphate transporter, PiT family